MINFFYRFLALTFLWASLFHFQLAAQSRYWVADSPANWNSDNWANSSNGAPDGGGPPIATESARFDANGNGNCTLNLALDTITDFVISNYTGILDLNGNTLRATGTVTLSSGTIGDNSGGSELVIASTGVTSTFNGTAFEVRVIATSDNIEMDGSRFTKPCFFEKTGSGSNYGNGNNVFLDSAIFTHSGAGGYFLLGGGNPDTFNDFVSMSITNAGIGYFAYQGAGNYFNGDIELSSTSSSTGIRIGANTGSSTISAGNTIVIGTGGFSAGELELRNITQQGNAALNITATGATTYIDIIDCFWGGNVTLTTPRLFTRGSTYTGLAAFTKNGAENDASAGGNHFLSDAIVTNSGSGYLLFGNGSPDSFDLDLAFNNTGSYNSYLAYNSADNYIGGDFTISQASTGGTASYFYVSQLAGSSVQIDGNVSLSNSGSTADCRVYFGDVGTIDIDGDLSVTNSSTGASGYLFIANNSASNVTIGGVTNVINNQSGTNGYIYLGNGGSITFTDSLNIENLGGATNCYILCNQAATSNNAYNGPITIENTNAAFDAIQFGGGGGASTLAAGLTISLGTNGYSAGDLYLRNFTQTGATAQNLVLSPTTTLTIYDCDFGGDINFSAANVYCRGSDFAGDLTLRKTGSNHDNCPGGNTIVGVTTLTNIGTGYWLWGNGSPDSFMNHLTIYDSSSYNFYLAYNSADNYVGGNLTLNKHCSGTGSSMQISDQAASTLEIVGNVNVNITSTSDNDRLYFGNAGDASVGGDFEINNLAAGTAAYVYLANGTTSELSIAGNVSAINGNVGTTKQIIIGSNGILSIGGRLEIENDNAITSSEVYVANGTTSDVDITGVCASTNNGSGTTRRLYFANYGSVSFGDSLIIINSSDATNSQVYLHNANTSSATFDGDILVECTNASCDGILFGSSAGVGTLAAGQTISISANGFIGEYLLFRNFTQVGATPQSLHPTGSGYIYNYQSQWGGDVDFSAPRMYTYDTRYLGEAVLEKTGAGNDQCHGLNYFAGNTQLACSGDGYLLLGNGNPDTFMLDLSITNSGTYNFYLGYNGGVNYVGGDLTIDQSTTGTSSTFYACVTSTTTLQVDGDVSITNSSTATSNGFYFGNDGPVLVGGNVDAINSSSATSSILALANATNSSLDIGGRAKLTNSGMGGTSTYIYFGNYGDVTLADSLILINSSNSTNNRIFCNHQSVSAATYGGDILIESSHVDGDGITFGQGGGSATFAAGQSIVVGSGGYVAGELDFYNFTQQGNTAQTILATGTADLDISNSVWGGDIDFEAPRLRTINTSYAGTTSLEKTGAIDDNSSGGNYFAGNTQLTNSGSGYMMMGSVNPDSFMMDVNIQNTGTYVFYLGQGSADNYIGGDLTVGHTPTGTSTGFVICNGAGTSLTIDGSVDITNTPTSSSSNFYLGNTGDVSIGGRLDVIHTATANANQFLLGYSLGSDVDVAGVTDISISGTGSNSQVYFGYQGDVTFGDSVLIQNGSSASASEVRIAYEDSSDVLFNGDLLLESSHADCDGVVFGVGGGNATLADGQRVVVGPNGYIAGALYFYTFHQVGNTSQSLTTTGTSYIYNYQSEWEADVALSGPRNRSDYSDYGGTLYFEKSGATDEQGAGGNTIAGNTTLVCSGSDYMMWGNTAADSFMLDLTLTNTGGEGIYVANNGAGHYVGGNLSGSNTANGINTFIILANGSTSDITIDGNVSLNNNGVGTTSQVYIGNSGSASIGGNLTIDNISNATNTYAVLANASTSTVNITGVTKLTNTGTGNNGYAYFGSSGDISFGDSLYILNSASAGNSNVYLNHSSSSTNTYAGDIVIESSDANCDGIQFGAGGGSGTLAAGQTISINSNGFIAGLLYFRNFTQLGATPQSLVLTGSATLNNYNSNWGGNVNFESPRHYTYNTHYSGTAYLEKTGSGSDASAGGNTIVGAAELVNTGSGYFLFGNGAADSLLSSAIFTNSGTHSFYFAYSTTGNYIGGDLDINQSTTGTSTYFYLSNNSTAGLTIDGNVSIVNNSTASDSRLYIGNSGDIDLNGRLAFTNTATGANGYAYFASGSTSNVDVQDVARFEHAPTGSTTHALYVANSGTISFGDSAYILNSSTAANNLVYVSNASTSATTFNGHVVLETSNAAGDGIYFGNGGGLSTLAAGNTITIGPNGFVSGQLYFRNFDQNGATPQSLSLTGTGTTLNIYDSDWDGDLDFDAPRVYTSLTTYNGDLDLHKTGATNDASNGGNVYNGNTTFRNSGSGYFMVPNNVTDDFNGDVTFVKTSTGLLYPSYSANSTFAGDINFNTNSVVTLGANTGRIIFDGTGPQSINELVVSLTPLFRRITLDKSADTLTLNMPIDIQTDITFTDGILISDVTNIINIYDNATATGASNASFVLGYVLKTGNDAFEFPVGDSLFRPISISAPSSGSAQFRARYFNNNPAPTYAYGLNDAPIDHHSTREYWMLDRVNLTNNVNVILSWDVNSGGVTDLSELLVARWDGDSWTSHGNGGTTGNTTTGTVVTSTPVSSFSPFTLASTTANNPLPIELLSFSARAKNKVVELEWSTASETNNDYFTIERSEDGLAFSALDQIAGAGQSKRILNYNTVDENPLHGRSYYRLKQTDYDGSFSYSQIDAVHFAQLMDAKIFASNNTIEVGLETQVAEAIEVSVLDVAGRVILNKKWNTDEGENSFSINQSELGASGVYLIRLDGAHTQFSERVFIR